MNTKHSWQTRATVKYIFLFPKSIRMLFLCDTWLEVFFFVVVFFLQRKLYRKSVIDFKLRILQMVQLQGRRSRLCVFVIYVCWLAFREASMIHRMRVCIFVQKKLSSSKMSFYAVFVPVNAVT